MAVIKPNLSAPAFYLSNESFAFTFRMQLRLTHEVDGGVLRHAVDAAMLRYPYFALRAAVEDEEIVLHDNPRPVVVKRGLEPVTLSSEESNEHLIALCYEGDTICFDVSHALMDGTGALPWVKTVLYYYLCEREGTQLDPTGIRLSGSEIPREEIDEPYPEDVPPDAAPFGMYKPVPAFRIPERRDGAQICYHVRIPENAFIRYSKEQDGSPATLTCVFLAKAIAALNPHRDLPIVGGMALNIRPALGKPLAHHCHVPLLYLRYDDAKIGYSVDRLATCSRGMVMLQSQPENTMVLMNGYKRLVPYLKSLPYAQKRALMSRNSAAAKDNCTFSVSYVGRANWGALESYIDTAHIGCDASGLGIMIELMAANGGFDYCFMQEFEGDRYVRQFVAELEKEGIACELSGPYPLLFPKDKV